MLGYNVIQQFCLVLDRSHYGHMVLSLSSSSGFVVIKSHSGWGHLEIVQFALSWKWQRRHLNYVLNARFKLKQLITYAPVHLKYFRGVYKICEMHRLTCLHGWRIAWWRHQMETFSALLAICPGNSPVTGEFPAQKPVAHSFDVFFDLRLTKRLSKQWWGWWFETPSCPLWRHRKGYIICS